MNPQLWRSPPIRRSLIALKVLACICFPLLCRSFLIELHNVFLSSIFLSRGPKLNPNYNGAAMDTSESAALNPPLAAPSRSVSIKLIELNYESAALNLGNACIELNKTKDANFPGNFWV